VLEFKCVALLLAGDELNLLPKTTIYPVDGQGAVFEFIFNKENDHSEVIKSISKSVGQILSVIPQRLVSGNIDGFTFGGTNIYMETNRLLLIKGENAKEQWSGNAVLEDVKRVVSTSQGSK